MSYAIASAFSGQAALSCRLGYADAAFVCLAVPCLSLLCSARAAHVAANIEPSIVIREI